MADFIKKVRSVGHHQNYAGRAVSRGRLAKHDATASRTATATTTNCLERNEALRSLGRYLSSLSVTLFQNARIHSKQSEQN